MRSDTTIRGSDDEGGSAPDTLRLEVVRSPDEAVVGATVELTRERPALLGRDVAEGLRVEDPRLSRLHLRVSWDSARAAFVYRDGPSMNGTFVNGERAEAGLLLPGDVVRIGDTLLVCVDRDASAELRGRARRAAESNLSVLLRGETGSGKEVAARLIHEHSRRSGPFVAINCAALPGELAASELFGHTKGAFSGAAAARPGVFRAAEGGTLLLDEIGDLPLELQGLLLRVLQEGKVRPVGSDHELPTDVRIVAATHVDLSEAAAAGRFRTDLLARLSQLVLQVPALRDRRTEVLGLVREFAPELTLTPGAAEALLCWHWPLNVRELKGLVDSHVALAEPGAPLRAGDLVDRVPPAELVLSREATRERASSAVDQRRRLSDLLKKHEGNVTRVAEELGKPRAQIYRWIRAFGLERPASP